ncbi:hypothetical protein HETIRDRAFT_437867, partial [Heterobasidion irregulare TC 32-1]
MQETRKERPVTGDIHRSARIKATCCPGCFDRMWGNAGEEQVTNRDTQQSEIATMIAMTMRGAGEKCGYMTRGRRSYGGQERNYSISPMVLLLFFNGRASINSASSRQMIDNGERYSFDKVRRSFEIGEDNNELSGSSSSSWSSTLPLNKKASISPAVLFPLNILLLLPLGVSRV